MLLKFATYRAFNNIIDIWNNFSFLIERIQIPFYEINSTEYFRLITIIKNSKSIFKYHLIKNKQKKKAFR